MIGSKAIDKRWRHRFHHYKSMGAFCCHGNQSFDPICPKILRSLSSTPVMLHIKFNQDWPTGFRDIKVWKCGRRRTTTTDDDGRRTIGILIAHLVSLRLKWAKKSEWNFVSKISRKVFEYWSADWRWWVDYLINIWTNSVNFFGVFSARFLENYTQRQ